MKRVLRVTVAAAALVLLAGIASAQDAKVEKGKAVYAASGCKMCHSIAGVGNSKGALDDVGSKLTAADIKAWLTDPAAMAAKTKAERKPAMKLVKPLSAEDIDALTAYLQTLKKK
jgi:mono/diheme cytochrome c family protein